MATLFAEFDQYSENLLMAQYDVADIISHELTKGEMREDFLRVTLESCSEPKPTLVRGTLIDERLDAGQLDIILCRPHAHPRRLGAHCLVAKDDALCVIEVKGNCTGRDLAGAMRKALQIQNLDGENNPLYGIVAYKVELGLRTIMSRFGFSYDAATSTYFDNATIPNEAEHNWRPIQYSDLDFFISLDHDKKIFLRKYQMGTGQYRFTRSLRSPLIQELFSMIRGLWIPTNQ